MHAHIDWPDTDEKDNIRVILFYGAGEVAELAYLYLQLTDIRLAGIIDENLKMEPFFGYTVFGLERIDRMDWDIILLTRLDDTDQDIMRLIKRGIDTERIATL